MLGSDSPKALQRAVFFSIGLNFVLRGVEEQHSLVVEQIVRHPSDLTDYSDNVFYEYID